MKWRKYYYLEGPSKRSFGKREILILNVFLKHGIGVVAVWRELS